MEYSSSVKCVVNFYGPSDFTKSYDASVDAKDNLPLLPGGNSQQERHRHMESSPLYWVTPEVALTLFVHGTRDAYVAHEQAEWIVERMKAADVETTLMTIADGDHGLRTSSPDVKEKIENARFEFL